MSAEQKTSREWITESEFYVIDPHPDWMKTWEEPITKETFDRWVGKSAVYLKPDLKAEKEQRATLMVHHYVLGAQHMLTSIEEALSMNQMLRKKQSWTLTELKHMLHQVPKLNEEQMIAGLMENMP